MCCSLQAKRIPLYLVVGGTFGAAVAFFRSRSAHPHVRCWPCRVPGAPVRGLFVVVTSGSACSEFNRFVWSAELHPSEIQHWSLSTVIAAVGLESQAQATLPVPR